MTSHKLHFEKRSPSGLVAQMPVPSPSKSAPTKSAIPNAAVVERLFRPLANDPVAAGAVWEQFELSDVLFPLVG